MPESDYRPDKVAAEIPEGELRAARDHYRRRADNLNEFYQFMEVIWSDRKDLPTPLRGSAGKAHDCISELSEWYEAVQWEIEERLE